MKRIKLRFNKAPKNPEYTRFTNLLFDIECLYYAIYLQEKEGNISPAIFYRNKRLQLAEETKFVLDYISYSSPLVLALSVFTGALPFSILLSAISNSYDSILKSRDAHELRQVLITKIKEGNATPQDYELLEKVINDNTGLNIIKRISISLKYFGSFDMELK